MTNILGDLPEGHELFVFLGTAMNSKNKPCSLWITAAQLDAASPEGYDAVRVAAAWYAKKGDTTGVVGGLYSIKAERDGERCSMWFGTKRYSGMSSHSLIAAFQAADDTARDAEYRLKNERKAKEPVYMRDMERTVEALRKLPRRQALDIVHAIGIELRRRVLEA
jgi:hypothetical protein